MEVIAIIGDSNDRTKFGNKAVRAFKRQGWIPLILVWSPLLGYSTVKALVQICCRRIKEVDCRIAANKISERQPIYQIG
jgi:hypothetical protein